MCDPDLELYTKRDVNNARTKGQLIGWVQGGAVVLVGAVLLSFIGFIGWISTLVVLGVGGLVLYRLMSSPKGN